MSKAKKKVAKGGTRVGAGRKPIGADTMKAGIYVRCSQEQKDAMEAFVAGMSEDRERRGLPRVDISTWLRELGLKHSGNEHLGAAARARAKAEAAESIV